MILHIEHDQHPGPYRITANQPDMEGDVLAWLWDGDAPDGTQLTLAEQQLAYNKFDLTGVHQDESTHLRPEAYEWLSRAEPETYEDYLARLALEQQRHEDYLASPVPHLGGVTFGQVWQDFEQWKGFREMDGWFVWIGFDEAEGGSAIEMWEMPTDERVRNDIRWYLGQGNSLNQAVRSVIQDQFEELKVMVFMLASG